jgi:DNA-binding XRE family transcriptional regulator
MLQIKVEEFERDGTTMVAMPMADWLRIEDELEDVWLVRVFDEAMASNKGPSIPMHLAMLIIDGAHPLKVFREHRNLSQAELGALVGVQQPAIARIESRERTGRPALLAKLATALEMPLETLMDFA